MAVSFCTFDSAVWTILLLVACVCLLLSSAVYVYYLSLSPGVLYTVLFVISIVFLVFFAALGVYAALRRRKSVLLYFATVMIVMTIFTLGMFILVVVALQHCQDPNSVLYYICNVNVGIFFAHSIFIIFTGVLAAASALFLRRCIRKQEKDPDNFY